MARLAARIDVERPVFGGFAPNTVVVVDEAGMVGTRDLDRLLTHADNAGAKVVLVGDDRQLPEIKAGARSGGSRSGSSTLFARSASAPTRV